MTSLLYAIALAQHPLRLKLSETLGERTVYSFHDTELVKCWAQHHALIACLVELRDFGRITPDYREVAVLDEKPYPMFIRRSRWTAVMEWAPPVVTEDDVQYTIADDVAA